MRICYVLLSSTFGTHQYAADPANQMACAGHNAHLVTTTHARCDRYLHAYLPVDPESLVEPGFPSFVQVGDL